MVEIDEQEYEEEMQEEIRLNHWQDILLSTYSDGTDPWEWHEEAKRQIQKAYEFLSAEADNKYWERQQ